MRKLLRNKAFVIAMCVMAVGLIAKDFLGHPFAPAQVAARTGEAPPLRPLTATNYPPLEPPLVIERRLQTESVSFPAGDLRRNPFQFWPPAVRAAERSAVGSEPGLDEGGLSRLKLQGISIDADRGIAVINRRIVSVGDTIEGFTVEAIRSDEVILKYSQGIVHLRYPTAKATPLQPRNSRNL